MGVLKATIRNPGEGPRAKLSTGTQAPICSGVTGDPRIIADFTRSANGRRPDELRTTQTALQSRRRTQNSGICRGVVPGLLEGELRVPKLGRGPIRDSN